VLIAVGGHSRNVGKTGVVTGLIRALPEFGWTAIKITGHRHGNDDFLLAEEHSPLGAGDSARYLAAGAAHSFLLRAAGGGLASAVPALREILANAPHVIIESNRILDFIRPDLYLVVLDFSVPDFKESTRRHLGRATAFVAIRRGCSRPAWAEFVPLDAVPIFDVAPPEFTCPALTDFVRARLGSGPRA
jgi:hypothetical protein